MNRPREPPLVTADIGENPKSAGGAPGGAGPYVTGLAPRARLRKPCPSGEAVPKGPPRGAQRTHPKGVSQTPGASRRSISLGERKKGKGGPAPLKKIKA